MFRLAHLSDPHLGPLPEPSWRELMGKRLTGYINWRRGRASHHRMDVLDRLMGAIAAEAPDHVAVTGDLINIGLEAEYPQARSFLWRLGPPERVSFVPGNHDTYARSTVSGMVHHWRPWFLDDQADETTGGYAFPYLRRRGRVGIVGLCSGVPTPPFLATGALGSRQIAAMQDMLEDLQGEGLARVVLIHHPPFDIGWQKHLVDHAELARALARSGCELVLHGHTHKGTRREIAGPGGPIPVVGVPSASAAAGGHEEPAAWNLVTIDGEPGDWRIEVERRTVTR